MRIIEFLPNLETTTIFILTDSEKIVRLKSKVEVPIHPSVDFLDYDSIHCEHCDNFLILNNLLIKNAPSEYWHELLDCWACHNEDYNSKLKGHQNGRILAKKGNLLLSDSSLILHSDDLRDSIHVSFILKMHFLL